MAKNLRTKAKELFEKASIQELQEILSELKATLLSKIEDEEIHLEEKLNALKKSKENIE